jgi:hypothetical protein
MVGRAKRALSCFVMTLSYSRALYLEFFFDQTMENFLRGHVHAFEYWHGQPRVILYDNLKSAVLERRGNQIQFHPRLIELSAHYHFAPRRWPASVARCGPLTCHHCRESVLWPTSNLSSRNFGSIPLPPVTSSTCGSNFAGSPINPGSAKVQKSTFSDDR